MSQPKVDIAYFSIYALSLLTFMADLNKIYYPSYNKYSEYITQNSTAESKNLGSRSLHFRQEKPDAVLFNQWYIRIYLRSVFEII